MLDRGLPRPRSLHRQLLLWLLLPQAVLWITGAAVSYQMAARYANRAIDASLTQSMRSLARQVKPIGNGLFIDFPRAAQDIIEADPDDRVYYMVSTPPGQFILGNRTLPAPPDVNAQEHVLSTPLLYDGLIEQTPVRVAALYLRYAEDGPAPQVMLVQVARGRTSRDVIAREILSDIALPMSGLILLMSMIVWAGIRAGLAPLDRLRATVEQRAPNDLAPLRIESAPSELHSLVGALNALLGAVQGNLVAQRRFINDAAHQLRTPLAGLKGQAELALRESSDPALRPRLERLHTSAARGAHLVSQLLTLARAEPETAAALGRTRFDLTRLVQDVTAEQVPRALRAGADLGLDDQQPPGPLWVDGHAFLLREALLNLIDNAVRYGGRGNEITVRLHTVGDQAVIDVDDTGPGLPAALLETVFERFYRVDQDGEGCGLGLAIVREIVERQAGTVQLERRTPRGLRATVRLPLVPAPQGD